MLIKTSLQFIDVIIKLAYFVSMFVVEKMYLRDYMYHIIKGCNTPVIPCLSVGAETSRIRAAHLTIELNCLPVIPTGGRRVLVLLCLP